MNCKHKTKYIERVFQHEVKGDGYIRSWESKDGITTWCADCGKKLKEVELK